MDSNTDRRELRYRRKAIQLDREACEVAAVVVKHASRRGRRKLNKYEPGPEGSDDSQKEL